MITSFKNYIVGAYRELHKVTWLTSKQIFSHTGIVLVVSLFLALFIGVFDYFFQLGYQTLFDIFGV
jgi:preprotein translocase SecE subunit